MARSNPRALWPYALAAAAIAFLAGLPALNGGFVNWDDDLNFMANPNYRGLAAENIRWMFTTFHMGPYQPLAWLTLGLDYTLWGMAPRGYHFTSLLLHAATAAAFVLLAATLVKDRRAALFGALVWALHPLRVESFAWVTERRDVVSGLFFVLMLQAYLGRPRRPRAAFAFFGLSLLGKATAVTAPLLLVMLDVWPLRRSLRDRTVWLEKAAYLGVAALFGVLALIGQQSAGAFRPIAPLSLLDRLALTARASSFYLLKLVVPAGLSPLYELKPGFNPLGPDVLIGTAVLLAITIGLMIWRKPAPLVAWLGYLLLILPVSGIAKTGHQFAADRYTYLAMMPVGLLLAGAIERRPPLWKVVAPVVALLGGLTFMQCGVWRDSLTLWTHALKVDATSTGAAINKASALLEVQRVEEAAAVYRSVLARDPANRDALYSLGMVHLMQARNAEAAASFAELVRVAPGQPLGYYGLGILAMQEGRVDDARQFLRRALELKPDMKNARDALNDLSGSGSPPRQ